MTGVPELDDVIETLHYRLVVSQEPGTAVVAVAHLLAEVSVWLDELEAEAPAQHRRVDQVKHRQWHQAAAAVTVAANRHFGQRSLFNEIPA